MTKIRKLSMALLVVTLLMISAEISYAAGNEDLPPTPTEGTASSDLQNGEGLTENEGNFSIQSTQYLWKGESYIRLLSGSSVSIGGTTNAYSSVDTIAVNLFLQRWDSSRGIWVDVVNVGEFKKYNTSIASGSKDVNVVSGYYYRTRTHHWVNQRGIVEQNSSVSSYIFVN